MKQISGRQNGGSKYTPILSHSWHPSRKKSILDRVKIIFFCGLFLPILETDFTSYADVSTLNTDDESGKILIRELENDVGTGIRWLSSNTMKVNPNKFYLLFNSNDQQENA